MKRRLILLIAIGLALAGCSNGRVLEDLAIAATHPRDAD